jgi:hypothetical protein
MWRLLIGILVLIIAIGTATSDDPGDHIVWTGGFVLGPYLIFRYFKVRRDQASEAVIEDKLISKEAYVIANLEQKSIYDIGNDLYRMNNVPLIYGYQYISDLTLTRFQNKLPKVLPLQQRKNAPKISSQNELETLSFNKNIYAYEEDLTGFSGKELADDAKGAILLTTGYLYFLRKQSNIVGSIVGTFSDKAIEKSLVYGLGWAVYELASDIKHDVSDADHKFIKSLKNRLDEKQSLAIDLRTIKKAEVISKNKRVNLIMLTLVGIKITYNDNNTFAFFNKDKTTKDWSEKWLYKFKLALLPEGVVV